jgi:hypothetical protein
VKFNVSVLKNSIPLKNVEVRYEISEDMMKPHKTDKGILKDGTMTINAGTMKNAGFLRCHVFATYNNNEYEGVATVGFNPESIVPTTELPTDFVQFWDKAKAEAAKIPMDIMMTLVPERCTEKWMIYHVSVQNMNMDPHLWNVVCSKGRR